MLTRRALMHGIGTAGAWACAPAIGQSARRLRRVGWLDDSSFGENLGVFMQAMKALGWIAGQTLKLEYRGADRQAAKLEAAARELAALPVDVIVVPSSIEALAVKRVGVPTPVVMVGVDDPVGQQLVRSLSRPGGNITGLSTARGEVSVKLISLLREQFPAESAAAVLWDATDPDLRFVVGRMQGAATSLGLALSVTQVDHHSKVEAALAAIRKAGHRILVVPPSSMLIPRWIADLSRQQGLALASTAPAYAYEGGLLSYSPDWRTVYSQAAGFVHRILAGEKPADLPVELPTKYKLVLNLVTARELKLNLVRTVMMRADHLVE